MKVARPLSIILTFPMELRQAQAQVRTLYSAQKIAPYDSTISHPKSPLPMPLPPLAYLAEIEPGSDPAVRAEHI